MPTGRTSADCPAGVVCRLYGKLSVLVSMNDLIATNVLLQPVEPALADKETLSSKTQIAGSQDAKFKTRDLFIKLTPAFPKFESLLRGGINT